MPNRIIRDSCRTSPSLAALGDLAERTFWRLTTVLDDFGRYHGTTRALLAACYPEGAAGLTEPRFVRAVTELEAQDLVRFYEIDGRRYIYSPTWTKYQRRRASESKFPQPVEPQGCGHVTAAVRKSPSSAAVVVVVNGVVDGIVNEEKISAPRNGAGPEPDAFERFWQEYPKPRRRGKFEARQAWTALHPDAETVARIMRSLAAWKASHDWLKDGGKFVPWPQKFLRKHRWEELVEPAEARRIDGELPGLDEE